ncbi:hypothetical protein E4T56_gene3114 [Termitomyces sp. T112]|nr:hypothetical protein E4T56_gene3114 [Termitomyces sp. T112]
MSPTTRDPHGYPPPLVFPCREALYKDEWSNGRALEEERGGEFGGIYELELRDEVIEAGDRIYITTVHPPPSVAEIRASQTTSQRLAQAFAANTMPQEFQNMVLPYLHVFEDVFSKASFNLLPECKRWDHAIKLLPDSTPSSLEWNYKIHDKEMLAIIWLFKEWWHFLEGAWHKFKVWTDYKNHDYFQMAKKLNCWQAQWSLYLANFDFSLHHKPGWSIGKPDALFWRVDHGMGEGDNSNIMLLRPELFAIQAMEGLTVNGAEADILQNIQWDNRGGQQEELVAQAAWTLKLGHTIGVNVVCTDKWALQDGILTF